MKQTSKGFSMIELLVVVTIIAILAAIIITNVTQYVNRGKNSGIKSNLGTALTNSAVYFDQNGNYTDFCTTVGYTNPEAEVNKSSGGLTTAICTDTAFCACSPLRVTAEEDPGSTFCVDSSGFKGVSLTDCATRCTNLGACSD